MLTTVSKTLHAPDEGAALMARRFLLAAILSANVALAGASPAAASAPCPSGGGLTGCCCPRPEPTEEPGAQAPCCCAPGEPGAVVGEDSDQAPPPVAQDGGAPDRPLDADDPLRQRSCGLAADVPLGPTIARYLLLGCVRR